MYFGKQNNINRDYYNDYLKSKYQYNDEKTDYLTFVLKILIILLLLGIIFVGFIFISHRVIPSFKNGISTQKAEFCIPKEKVVSKKREDIKKKNQDSLTQEDIANIVAIVMTKVESSSKEDIQNRGEKLSDDEYSKELFLQDVDKIRAREKISIKNINTKKVVKESSPKLSKKNHYNKVVIKKSKKDKYTNSNDRLSQLSQELNSAINDNQELFVVEDNSYTQEISKELLVRSNEMRTIVVSKGDTLSKIAKKAYGSYDDYIKIFEANPEIINNPDEIYVGQVLRIPL